MYFSISATGAKSIGKCSNYDENHERQDPSTRLCARRMCSRWAWLTSVSSCKSSLSLLTSGGKLSGLVVSFHVANCHSSRRLLKRRTPTYPLGAAVRGATTDRIKRAAIPSFPLYFPSRGFNSIRRSCCQSS